MDVMRMVVLAGWINEAEAALCSIGEIVTVSVPESRTVAHQDNSWTSRIL